MLNLVSPCVAARRGGAFFGGCLENLPTSTPRGCLYYDRGFESGPPIRPWTRGQGPLDNRRATARAQWVALALRPRENTHEFKNLKYQCPCPTQNSLHAPPPCFRPRERPGLCVRVLLDILVSLRMRSPPAHYTQRRYFPVLRRATIAVVSLINVPREVQC